MPKPVFVFGSNEAGIHGAGAAYVAWKNHGAERGIGIGHVGNSYAIPTKDKQIQTLPLERVKFYVQDFIHFAAAYGNLDFQVTRIGCGLAGFTDEDIAPLFKDAPPNCSFDTAWKPYLGEGFKYWGHVG